MINSVQFYQRGLTLVELMVVIGILAMFFSLTLVNLTNIVPRANVTTATDVLVADLKQQQQKSMSGETGTATASGNAQPYGIHIDSNQYVLYSGVTYSAVSASNAAVPVSEALELTTTFPSSNILFNKGSGEVSGYTSSTSATITVRDTVLNQQRTIRLNKLGVITGVD